MTPEEVNEKMIDFKKKLDNAISKEDLAEIQKETAEFLKTNSETMEMLKSELATQLEQINALKEKQLGAQSKDTLESVISKSIDEKYDEIVKAFKNNTGVVEILKGGDISTGSVGTDEVPNLFPQQYSPIGNVQLRENSILNLVNTIPTSLVSYPYTESIPADGDAEFVAEGNEKPKISFSSVVRYASPLKIAVYEHLTEESITDVKGLKAVAIDFLKKKHDRKKAKLILNGTGGSEPKGATIYGRVFNAGAMALQIVTPNITDVINAGITDVYTTHNFQDEINYKANICMLNPIDFFTQVVGAKDGFGHPLYPTAGLFNMVIIAGVMIIPDEDITVGKVFIADLSKYNVTDYLPYSVRIGMINDDFIRNMFVILAESRFHAFVKELDKQAFIYDDIETIKLAITKP